MAFPEVDGSMPITVVIVKEKVVWKVQIRSEKQFFFGIVFCLSYFVIEILITVFAIYDQSTS